MSNATIEDMHRAEAGLNAALVDAHLQVRKARAWAEIRAVLDRYGLDVDWEAVARHAEDARRQHDIEERWDAGCTVEIDADDIEQRCTGRLPLAEQ